jgi:5'-methylthioadenosine phosphorylase
MGDPPIRIAVIAGSGMYEMAGLEQPRTVEVETPFGKPSDAFVVGRLSGQDVVFLARHGKGHRLLPSELNHRANIFALKSLGVERILSASAVGSMREEIRPREGVIIDQFIDRTTHRPATFFGGGIAAHVSFADPLCGELRGVLLKAGTRSGARLHDGGTYVCIEGPAFSTRAESEWYRSMQVDVIGMTNLQEAKLAREAEICYATLALVTDYDCWHSGEEDVNVEALLANLRANQKTSATLLAAAIEAIPQRGSGCGCADALAGAIITDPAAIERDVRRRLEPIVGRYLPDDS